jgi:hypothetical protein
MQRIGRELRVNPDIEKHWSGPPEVKRPHWHRRVLNFLPPPGELDEPVQGLKTLLISKTLGIGAKNSCARRLTRLRDFDTG